MDIAADTSDDKGGSFFVSQSKPKQLTLNTTLKDN